MEKDYLDKSLHKTPDKKEIISLQDMLVIRLCEKKWIYQLKNILIVNQHLLKIYRMSYKRNIQPLDSNLKNRL